MNGEGRRQKGHNGEREVVRWLTELAGPVCVTVGSEVPVFERNITQSRDGGYDVKGLEWLAVEVKRVETEFQRKWWLQLMKSKEEAQVPLLLFRRNRRPWRAMVQIPTSIGGRLIQFDAVLEQAQFEAWFRWQLWSRLTCEPESGTNTQPEELT